ncbi:MAG: thioredoxin domain-containing protein [Polyangia bacterium]|jgi:protein-disulfide isomerase
MPPVLSRFGLASAALFAFLGAWTPLHRPVLATEDKPADGKGSGEIDTSPPPGIDLSKLDEYERKVFFRVVNREPSSCGKGHSLIYSVKHDAGCRRSVFAVRYVAKLVDSGYTDSEIAEELQNRYREVVHKDIDISRAPNKGPADARVTLIEFVDYECPHCRTAQALMRQVLDTYPRQVRLCFKHFPLSSHTNARLAAEAATAAHKQGKFWPYNDKVWANADSLTPAVLEKIAKEVGLDVTRWRSDMTSDEVKAAVTQDKSEGTALGINSTPTIYINGRKYAGRHDIESIGDWIDEELGK